MGCFLACFGFPKKKRRRKSASRDAAGDQKRGSYVPLDSSLKIIGVDGTNECANRDQPKDQTRFKTRKKVSFNLNVQTYEPISTDYHFFENDEEEETEKKGSKMSLGLFPSNHRYQNVRDSYDEEDYIDEVESDLEDDDDEEYDFDSDIVDQRISQEEFSKQFCSSSINGELECPNARDNILYVHSVLSPIENLTQWKAAKAKAAAPKQQKENIASSQEPRMHYSRSNYNQPQPMLQEIAVHASLSSWISSRSTN